MGRSEKSGPRTRGFGLEESDEDLYENAPCGYLSTLADGTIVRINRTLLGWLGYRWEELEGRRFQALLTIGGQIFYETHFAPLLAMQGFAEQVNFTLLRKDGRELPILINTMACRDTTGDVRLHRSTIFDITDRKKYERELLVARQRAEAAVAAKSRFLSMMSHEFRTPMNAIVGIANLLGNTELDPAQLEYVRVLKSSADHLLGLINDLLDASKLEAGKMVLDKRPFDLHQLVQQTVAAVSGKALEKHLPIEVGMDGRVPRWVMGDPVKLGQVLANLVGNAIKFTERGGVQVSVARTDEGAETATLRFEVRDSGIGIPAELIPNIFDSFGQGSLDIGRQYGGSGLGLWISRKLLQLQGSEMVVQSVEGEGSSFAFTLHLPITEPVESEPIPGPEVAPQPLAGLGVLVAEDTASNVFILGRLLERWGARFDVVGNGRDAVDQVLRRDYDVVLMDLQMPKMDGVDAMHNIRGLGHRYATLPIIALSADGARPAGVNIGSGAFDDYVAKPFDPQALLQKLAKHVPQRPRPVRGPALVPPLRIDRLNVEALDALVEGEPAAVAELRELAVASYETAKVEFQEALRDRDRHRFDFQVHKIRVTTELLAAHGLRTALERAIVVFDDSGLREAEVAALVRAIHVEIDAIIGVLADADRSANSS